MTTFTMTELQPVTVEESAKSPSCEMCSSASDAVLHRLLDQSAGCDESQGGGR